MKKMLIICFFAGLFYTCSTHDRGYLSSISTLPSFDILSLDSLSLIHSKDLPAGKLILMIYIRPDCPHSQFEARELIKNIARFQGFQIYFLTGGSLAFAKSYAHYFHLDCYPGLIKFGKDNGHSFARAFRLNGVPFLALYDKNKKLLKIYHGEVSADHLLSSIHG
jgi:hypothetical protein